MRNTAALQAAPPSNRTAAETAATTWTIARSEWRFVWILIVSILALTTVPYLFAWLTAPADMHFMGMMLDVPDHLQYFSWMRELSTAPLAANKLTPEANDPVFFNLLWWALGRLSVLTGLGSAAVFQILRWVSTAAFFVLVYRLAALFFAEPRPRRTALLITAFGSGLGWILVVLKYTIANGELINPLDLYVAEGNTFLCILGYPHFVAAALYAFVFDVVLRGWRSRPLRTFIIAGLIALFFGLQHAYDLIIVWAVLGAWAGLMALRDRRIALWPALGIAIVGAISVWPALYSVLLTTVSPLWKEVLAQFDNAGVFTPPPWRLPVLLGIPFVLALICELRARPWRLQGQDDHTLFLRGWFWISFVLVYLPVDYQIHMLNGWQIPIAFIATYGLYDWLAPALAAWWHGRRSARVLSLAGAQRWVVALCLLAIVPTNLYLFAWRFVDLGRYANPYFLHSSEVAALDWLEANAAPDDRVLSALAFGQFVPAETGTYAFLAHWAQTVDFFAKQRAVHDFYDPATSNSTRATLLDEFSVDYVLHGPSEEALGPWSPDAMPQLTSRFTTPTVTIYAYAPAQP